MLFNIQLSIIIVCYEFYFIIDCLNVDFERFQANFAYEN